jgi:hypothetical protein
MQKAAHGTISFTICDVGVAGDPSTIRGAPVDVRVPVIKHSSAKATRNRAAHAMCRASSTGNHGLAINLSSRLTMWPTLIRLRCADELGSLHSKTRCSTFRLPYAHIRVLTGRSEQLPPCSRLLCAARPWVCLHDEQIKGSVMKRGVVMWCAARPWICLHGTGACVHACARACVEEAGIL